MSLQDQHIRTHPHLPHKFTAEMFLEKLIGKIWDGLLLIWEHRNEIQHQADENDPGTTDRLKNQIQAIYEDASNLPALEQFPFQAPIEEIFTLTHPAQHDWIEIHRKYVDVRQSASIKRAQREMGSITRYFQPRKRQKTTDTVPPDLQFFSWSF